MAITKILIVEDADEMVSGKLKDTLSQLDNVKIVGHVLNSRQALIVTNKYRPDIVILDIDVQGDGGLFVLKLIKQKFPGIKVIVISKYLDERFRQICKELNADYFFEKSSELQLLVNTINRIKARGYISEN